MTGILELARTGYNYLKSITSDAPEKSNEANAAAADAALRNHPAVLATQGISTYGNEVKAPGSTKQGRSYAQENGKIPVGTEVPVPKVPNFMRAFESADGTPIYSQNDPNWKDNKVGTGIRSDGTLANIGSIGCALTATAMALSKISGQTITPAELNEYLMKNNGYEGNNINWNVAAGMVGMGAEALSGMNFDSLNEQIEAGRPVVIAVDHTGDGRTDHYITVTRREGNTYYANDPATGKEMEMTLQNNKLVGQSGDKTYRSSGQLIYFTGNGTA